MRTWENLSQTFNLGFCIYHTVSFGYWFLVNILIFWVSTSLLKTFNIEETVWAKFSSHSLFAKFPHIVAVRPPATGPRLPPVPGGRGPNTSCYLLELPAPNNQSNFQLGQLWRTSTDFYQTSQSILKWRSLILIFFCKRSYIKFPPAFYPHELLDSWKSPLFLPINPALGYHIPELWKLD